MRVKDIMSQPVYSVRDSDTIERAAGLLAEKKITAAPVLDNAGKLVGMVSEGDLLWHRVPEDPTAHETGVDTHSAADRPETVAQVMSRHPVTTSPEADVADVAETMLYQNVRSEPVIDDGHIVGMISRRDIIRTVVHTDEVIADEIQHRLDEYGGVAHGWRATVSHGVATVDGSFRDELERTVVSIIARTVPGVAGVQLVAASKGDS
jgi:CBS domain-containing protein